LLDAVGSPRAPIGRGLLKRPTGVARDARSDQLYVADTYAHDIKVFDATGALLRTIGRRGAGDGEFNFPTHLAFVNGELYVTDTLNSRVQVFAADASLPSRRLGARGLVLGNLVRPKGVGVDGEGNVYVVESYHDSLLVFSAQGEFLLPIGGTGTATGRFYLPAGVWVDARNRVYVADMFNGRVVLFQFLGGG
jgi:DNA-binding beta-propeller fold protein YncE